MLSFGTQSHFAFTIAAAKDGLSSGSHQRLAATAMSLECKE
jgi:hypothetical protein